MVFSVFLWCMRVFVMNKDTLVVAAVHQHLLQVRTAAVMPGSMLNSINSEPFCRLGAAQLPAPLTCAGNLQIVVVPSGDQLAIVGQAEQFFTRQP